MGNKPSRVRSGDGIGDGCVRLRAPVLRIVRVPGDGRRIRLCRTVGTLQPIRRLGFESRNLTDWVDADTDYGFPLSLEGSNASERWQADSQSVNGNVTSSGTVEVRYRHEAFLTFAVQGPTGSTISPGSGWYDFGGSVQLTVGAPTGWAVGEWQGAGPGAYSGTQASPTVIVTGSFSETAILYAGLTIVAGGGGS